MEEKGEEASSAITCVLNTEQSPNLLVNQQNPKKKTLGRQKIEIKEIKDKNRRMVTFSKRRDGLHRKAAQISVLCGAQIGIITFSQSGKIYRFGNVETLIESYIRKTPVMLTRPYFVDDVDGSMKWWERPVESVPEEEIEEYVKALSVLRENLWRRLCEMDSGNRTVENVSAFSNPTAMN